jgi:heme ABC exporter ATP-binding subunit CcmA
MKKCPQNSQVICVEKLGKKFGHKTALRKIDLSLKKGDFLALFGPNGAGKTTLIQILSSLMRPSAGRATVLGLDTCTDREALCRIIGVISHNPFLYDNLTAFENLKFYGKMYDVAKLIEKIEVLIEMVGLSEYMHERVQTFSRGMQQRLSVARAIIHDPMILFLDEPFTGLDQQGAENLKQLLRQFQNQGKTMIMTSHDLTKGLELCNRTAILKSGSVVHEDDISKIGLSDFKHTYLKLTKEVPSPLAV